MLLAGCTVLEVAPARPSPYRVGTIRTGIRIPALAERDQRGSWHVVRKGETLRGVARTHGITMWRIGHYNGLSSDARLVEGQWLFITPAPVGKATTRPVAKRPSANQ